MSLEVSIRLFTHDLSDAILETKGKKLLLGSEKQHPDTDEIIMDYLTGNFEIRQNDEKSTLKLLGFELENDIMWLYVEAPMVENLRVLELSNKIIMDLYSEQKNILNVRDNKKTESQICSKAKPVHKFRFNP